MAKTPITDDHRRVLEINRDHPGATIKDIVGIMDDPALGVDYVQSVIHNYELPEETKVSPTTNGFHTTTDEENDEEEQPDAADEAVDEPVEEPTDDRPWEDADTDFERVRSLDSLTVKGQAVIRYLRGHPDVERLDHVDEALDVSSGYTRTVIKQNPHLVPEETTVWEKTTNPDEVTFDDLTANRQLVVREMWDDPDSTQSEVARATDLSEATVHTIAKQYPHLVPGQWLDRYEMYERNPDTAVNDPHGDTDTGRTEYGGVDVSVGVPEMDDDTEDELERGFKAAIGERGDDGADDVVETMLENYGAAADSHASEEDDNASGTPEVKTDAALESSAGNEVAVRKDTLTRLEEELAFHEEQGAVASTEMDCYAAGMRRVLRALDP